MLPGQLQAQYANDPGYQRYQQWHRDTGGRWGWWSNEAQKAAYDAGINMHVDTTGWSSKLTDWGETLMYDPSGQERSITNPAWSQFIQNYMQQHGPGTQYNQGGGDPNIVPDEYKQQDDPTSYQQQQGARQDAYQMAMPAGTSSGANPMMNGGDGSWLGMTPNAQSPTGFDPYLNTIVNRAKVQQEKDENMKIRRMIRMASLRHMGGGGRPME